jgi:adenine-specific DNA methylase
MKNDSHDPVCIFLIMIIILAPPLPIQKMKKLNKTELRSSFCDRKLIAVNINGSISGAHFKNEFVCNVCRSC